MIAGDSRLDCPTRSEDRDSYQGIASAMPQAAYFRVPLQGLFEQNCLFEVSVSLCLCGEIDPWT